MEESTIINVIRGIATEEEITATLDWINQSEENKKYFAEQKMLWTISTMPENSAGRGDFTEFTRNVIKKRRGSGYWIRKAVTSLAAVLLLFLVYTVMFRQWGNRVEDVEKTRATSNIEISTRKCVKGKFTLPDGSVVLLNSDSKITYPTSFAEHSREVTISGEACFEVVKDKNRPMHVKTSKGVVIEVLGTKFSIRAYDNDKETVAVLLNGSIQLTMPDNGNSESISVHMNPNDVAIIPENGLPVIKTLSKSEPEIAWIKDEMVFEDSPMAEVLKILERWYGKTYVVKNESIYKYKLNAKFKSESLDQILDIINACTSVNYKIEKDTVTFY